MVPHLKIEWERGKDFHSFVAIASLCSSNKKLKLPTLPTGELFIVGD